MKFLILIVCLGFAAADLRRAAAPLIDDVVSGLKEDRGKTGSLRHALGMPDAIELDEIEENVREQLVKKLKEKINAVLEKIQDKIDNGKNVALDLWKEVKECKEKLKELGEDIGEKGKELFRKIKEKASRVLKELLEKLGLVKRNLDQEYDVLARSSLRDLIEKIKQDLSSNENIRKIREYLRNFVTNNPVLQKLREFLLELKETDFRELLRGLFHDRRNSPAAGQVWDKMKDWFKKNVKEPLQEKFAKVIDWFKNIADDSFSKLKEKYGMIKALAMELIAHAKEIHGEVAREALEFLRPYKEDLGTLWDQLVAVMKEHIGSF